MSCHVFVSLVIQWYESDVWSKNLLLDSFTLIAFYKVSVTRENSMMPIISWNRLISSVELGASKMGACKNIVPISCTVLWNFHIAHTLASVLDISDQNGILCWDHPQAGQTTESIVFLVMYPLTLIKYSIHCLSPILAYQLTIRSVIQSTSRFPSTKTVERGNASRDIRVHEINFLRNRRW